MKLRYYRIIAEITGDRPIPIAGRLKDWAGEPIGGEITAPIMVAAYIASTLENKIELPSGNRR